MLEFLMAFSMFVTGVLFALGVAIFMDGGGLMALAEFLLAAVTASCYFIIRAIGG